jgi:hypothetical protein
MCAGWLQFTPKTQVVKKLLPDSAGAGGSGRKRRGYFRHFADEDEDEDEDEEDSGDGIEYHTDAADSSTGGGAVESVDSAQPWKQALASGGLIQMPLTPADAASADGRTPDEAGEAAEWHFPSTTEERHRYLVYRDLHSYGWGGALAAGVEGSEQRGMHESHDGMHAARNISVSHSLPTHTHSHHQGPTHTSCQPPRLHPSPHPAQRCRYRLTGGSKFGADYLIYPGDPSLFHAQFCVRLMQFDRPILPSLLSAACRGSHQARKHLILASVVEEEAAGGGDGSGAGADEAPAGPADATAEARGGLAGPTAASEGHANGALGVPLAQGCKGGVGPGGRAFRIHYMTIGPVDGFG